MFPHHIHLAIANFCHQTHKTARPKNHSAIGQDANKGFSAFFSSGFNIFLSYTSSQQLDFQKRNLRIGNSEPHLSVWALMMSILTKDHHQGKSWQMCPLLMVTHFKAFLVLCKLLAQNSAPFLEVSLNTVVSWKALPSAGVSKWKHRRSVLFSFQSFTADWVAGASKGFKFLTSLEAGKFPCGWSSTARNLFFEFCFYKFWQRWSAGAERIIWTRTTDPGVLGSQKVQPTSGRLIIKLLGTITKISSQVWPNNTEIQQKNKIKSYRQS